MPRRSSLPGDSDAQRLAIRLRDLADEIEAAERVGVPIPYMFSVNGHSHGGASFSATVDEFDAWAAYTDAEVNEYDHLGRHWRTAKADINGLPVSFGVGEIIRAVTA